MTNQVYDQNQSMTSATINTYPTKSDMTNNTNRIANYTVSAEYSAVDGTLTSYKMEKN